MLLFSKPKPRLADIIPDDYIDIHSHLLPGIDDGAKNIDDSINLINALKDYGFSQFITTPHVLPGVWNNTRQQIEEREQETLNFFNEKEIKIRLKAAAEYLMDDNFLKLFKSENLLTLKENYVLVEMSYLNAPIQLYDILFELQVAGYKPVLAHPERYLFYHFKFDEYNKLKKAGCLFQINLLSTVGYYGEHVAKIAIKLLENNMIDFTGSDVHHTKHVEAFKNKLLIKNTTSLLQALNKNSLFS